MQPAKGRTYTRYTVEHSLATGQATINGLFTDYTTAELLANMVQGKVRPVTIIIDGGTV